MEEFKKIVALSFIEAHQKNPLANSKNALAKTISEKINKNENGSSDEKHRYSKTLLNYYNYYFSNGKKQTPSDSIINKLLNYLGYDSKQQFVNNQPSDISYLHKIPFINEPNTEGGKEEKYTFNLPWKEVVITISFISVVSFAYFGVNWKQKECMIWSNDHYEKIACDKTPNPDLFYNQNIVQNFKRVELDTAMTIFKNGKALFWYDKDGGEIEFFTKGGRHPVNNKVLKPVTETIIRKYVFGEE